MFDGRLQVAVTFGRHGPRATATIELVCCSVAANSWTLTPMAARCSDKTGGPRRRHSHNGGLAHEGHVDTGGGLWVLLLRGRRVHAQLQHARYHAEVRT